MSASVRLCNNFLIFGNARTTCLRLSTSTLYSSKRGGKAKKGGHRVAYDQEMADGLVDLEKIRKNMENAVMNLQQDFTTKYNVQMKSDSLGKVVVPTEEGRIPLNELAMIKMKDDMYSIDMSLAPESIKAAIQAIKKSSPNLQPVDDGHCISIRIPKLTTEYRQNLVKSAKQACELSKQSIRNVRTKAMSNIRKNKKGRSEDDVSIVEKMVQQLTDEYTKDTDLLLEAKTKDLLRK